MASVFQLSAKAQLTRFETQIRNGTLEYQTSGPYKTALYTGELDAAFQKNNTTYSGTDCTVIAIVNEYMLVVGNATTISVSVHREKVPVRTLGHTYPKTFTYGSRTIAGHLIFCTFDEHPLAPLFNFFNKRTSALHRFSSPLSDDLPPIDIILLFNNESGSASVMRLYGLEFMDDGYVVSINDMYSETSMQWVARDLDPMIAAGAEKSWKQLLFEKQLEGKVIDEYYASLLQYKDRIGANIAQLDKEIHDLNTNVFSAAFNGTRSSDRQPAVVSNQGLIENSSQYTNDRNNAGSRQNRRDEIKIKQEKIKNLKAELKTLDSTITKYEKTSLTWDQNYAIDRSSNDQRFGPSLRY